MNQRRRNSALVHESSRKWDNYPDLGGPFGPIGHILSMNSRGHPKYKTKYRVSNWADSIAAPAIAPDRTGLL